MSWNDVELEVKTITSAVKNHFRSRTQEFETNDVFILACCYVGACQNLCLLMTFIKSS